MLSVLIPTYNWDTVNLVSNLHKQLLQENILFEIIVIDDCSKSNKNIENEKINKLTHCSFSILSKNVGRSAIRNLLVKKSKFDWLLFLDADVIPVTSKFIKQYINKILDKEHQVIVGGIAYSEDNVFKLRSKLGKSGEEKQASIRNETPYKFLFSANFLIDKKVFELIKFDERIVKYGYEDFLFAKELESHQVKITHIDNQVYHLGIDDNDQFIKKTKEALQNLVYLINLGKIDIEDTRISSLYKKIKSLKLIWLITFFKNFYEKNAVKKSSLIMYNLFRVTYLHKVFKDRK